MTSILIQARSKPIEVRAGDLRVNLSGGSRRVPARSRRSWVRVNWLKSVIAARNRADAEQAS